MEAMSKTTKGLWSTFKDNLNIVLAQFGDTLLPMIKAGLDKSIKLLGNFGNAISGLKGQIRNTAAIGIAFAKLFQIIGNSIIKMFGGEEGAIGAINLFQDKLLDAIGNIAFFFDQISKSKGTVKQDFEDMGETIVAVFGAAWDTVLDTTQTALIAMGKFFRSVTEGFTELQEGLWLIAAGDISGGLVKQKNAWTKHYADIKRIGKEANKDLATGGLSDNFERRIAELAKRSQDKLGGKITSMADMLLGTNASRAEFVRKFKEMALKGGDEFMKSLEGLNFDKLPINDMFAEAEKKKKSLQDTPALALRGSQAALKIGLAENTPEKEIAKNTEKTVDLMKILNNTAAQILAAAQAEQIGAQVAIDAFSPATMGANP
jgi:hypothetical protein